LPGLEPTQQGADVGETILEQDARHTGA
jgi:hypothetical protein